MWCWLFFDQTLRQYPWIFSEFSVQELIKYTEKDHRDYNNLVEAQGKMKEVAAYVNEVCCEVEMCTLKKIRMSTTMCVPFIDMCMWYVYWQHIVQKKREFENISKVRELQNSFEGKAEVPVSFSPPFSLPFFPFLPFWHHMTEFDWPLSKIHPVRPSRSLVDWHVGQKASGTGGHIV